MTQFTRNMVNMNISKSFLSQQGDKNKNYLKNKEKTQTKKTMQTGSQCQLH